MAIYADDVVLESVGVLRNGNIAHADRRLADHFNRHLIDVFRSLQQGVRVNVVVVSANLYVAGWQNHVLASLIERTKSIGLS